MWHPRGKGRLSRWWSCISALTVLLYLEVLGEVLVLACLLQLPSRGLDPLMCLVLLASRYGLLF